MTTLAHPKPQHRRSVRTAVLTASLTVAATAVVLPGSAAQALPSPALQLAAAEGLPGTTVIAKGLGFRPRMAGTITLADGRVGQFRSDKGGRFATRFVVPSRAAGTVLVSATSVGSGASRATASFTVLGGDAVQVAGPRVKPVRTPAPTASPTASPTAAPTTEPTTAPVSEPRTAPVTVSSAPPPAGGYFGLRPVGTWATLPNDAQAAALVRRSTWEPRPQNARANGTVPVGLALTDHGGVQPIWNSWLLPRVTGNFTGTTDEIVQWAAAKWGLPDELLRAQMVAESYWYQGLLDASGEPVPNRGYGDYTTDQRRCAPGYVAPCPLSFGVLQIKHASYHGGTFPHSRDSTAFNADYLAALLRGCYEGWETWLAGPVTARTTYAAGDLYGCVGRWYSGQWRTTAAAGYISSVQRHETTRPWLGAGF